MATTQIPLNETSHDFVKNNLISIIARRGTYDEYRCSLCDMAGKRWGLSSSIEVTVPKGTLLAARMRHCPKAVPTKAPLKIKISICRAQGKAFGNISPGSIHDVIEAPAGEVDDLRGFWVMGVGEPVKILSGEYTVFEK